MEREEGMEHLSALAQIAEQEQQTHKGGSYLPNFDLSFQSIKSAVADFFTDKYREPKAAQENRREIVREPLGVKVVMISDTHDDHRSLTVPDGDILIHAGDWTCFGRREQATDFNEWLETLPHLHKIVVNGNHENNATWKHETPAILSNATFLRQGSVQVTVRDQEVNIYGTDFFWPTAHCPHPFLDNIPPETDILVCHGPPYGLADGGKGCEYLQKKCLELAFGKQQDREATEGADGAPAGRLRLVVCGHIHYAYGMDNSLPGLTVVNASSCGGARKVVHEPITLEI
jgi:predicted phosphodiesterase